MIDFIDMVVDGEWKHTTEDWQTIQEEFSELSKDKSISMILSVQKDIAVLYNKCVIAEVVINSLEIREYPDLWTVLKKLGLMSHDLNIVKAQAKRFKIELDERKKDLAKMVSTHKTTRADFDSKLVTLSKFQGYRVDANSTTIAEYCAINNQFNAHVEAQKTQAEKNGTRPH